VYTSLSQEGAENHPLRRGIFLYDERGDRPPARGAPPPQVTTFLVRMRLRRDNSVQKLSFELVVEERRGERSNGLSEARALKGSVNVCQR
jgi:hypothetical protein